MVSCSALYSCNTLKDLLLPHSLLLLLLRELWILKGLSHLMLMRAHSHGLRLRRLSRSTRKGAMHSLRTVKLLRLYRTTFKLNSRRCHSPLVVIGQSLIAQASLLSCCRAKQGVLIHAILHVLRMTWLIHGLAKLASALSGLLRAQVWVIRLRETFWLICVVQKLREAVQRHKRLLCNVSVNQNEAAL